MDHYKYIFVVLVYRNTSDLRECLDSIKEKVSLYKVVVVNAFYDDISQGEAEKIAVQYGCDFINIENKGYSFGNNQGIEYARTHYEYDYIIISNPDIVVEKFDDAFMGKDFHYDIIAPQIIAASGKAQNPAAVKRSSWSEYLIYKGYVNNSYILLFLGLLITKMNREFILKLKKLRKEHIYDIYCAHGSFLLLSKKAVELLEPVYDENIFLFAEESVLAIKSTSVHLKTCYTDFISIHHKEDGSMKLSNLSVTGEMRKSNIYVYENYIMHVK